MPSPYPGALPATSYTTHLNAREDIAAIAATLGVNPQGPSSTVAARLAAASFGVNVRDYGAAPGNSAAQNNTAFTAASAAVTAAGGGVLYFPPGSYSYSGGLNLTVPCVLMGYGATLNYTGSGIAVKLGPDGLVYATRHEKAYIVQGLTFTGGGTMTHGVYFNKFVITCRVVDCEFAEFGNSSTYGVWFHDENWSAKIFNCRGYVDFANTKHWVKVNAAGGVNSTMFMMSGCQWNGYGGASTGVYLNGARNEIAHTKIEGGGPCVIVTPLATGTQLHNCYLESLNNNGAVAYGPASGADEVVGLSIMHCYFNVHNGDLSYTGAAVYPRTVDSGLRNFVFDHNDVSDLATTRSPVSIRTGVTGQSGNYYGLNTGVTTIPPNPSGQQWISPTTFLRS